MAGVCAKYPDVERMGHQSQIDVRSLQEIKRADPILKNENMALQKTIEGLENELAEALEKED